MPKISKNNTGLLQGKKELQEYLGGVSRKVVDMLIANGLPGAVHNGRLYFFPDNVDEFLAHWTRQRVRPEFETDPPT